MQPLTIIDDPADWTSSSLQGKEDTYTYHITEADIIEVLQVCRHHYVVGICHCSVPSDGTEKGRVKLATGFIAPTFCVYKLVH